MALVGASLAACGSDETAADAVPALAQHLDDVDSAIESGDLTAAAEAVRRLIDEATRAREDGRLDDAVAADVIRAADRLLDELAASTEPEPTETTETDPPDGDGDQGPDEGKDNEDGVKPDKDDEGGDGDDRGEGGGGDD